MHDLVWVLVATVVGLLAIAARTYLRRTFGRNRLGRLVAECLGWMGYCTALAIALVETNDGWHRLRSRTGGRSETHWTWPDAARLIPLIGGLTALANFVRLERRGEIPLPDGSEPAFPMHYVDSVLADEASLTRRECKQIARALRRAARRTGQPLPGPLAAYVSRHLDRPA